MHLLDSFFFPKKVAVIGASGQKESIGRAIFENFLNGSLKNSTFPVNPNHDTILGKKSYKTVKGIAKKIDLAVIVVPARLVPQVLKECTEKKVKAVIIISAGFSEIGEKKVTAQVQKIIDANSGTRVLGPNCFGTLCTSNNLNTTFSASEKTGTPKKGTVSFLSQSGALGVAIIDWMSTQEFGLSKFVSYGNAMDIDEADLLDYFSKDPDTKIITMYIEGVKEGRKFMEIAKKTSLKKPIVVLKGGVHGKTHAATASHTGSLAGNTEVYEAMFKQAGIIQAKDLQELFTFAKILENEPLPKGNSVQIITNGGGFGIVTADQVLYEGLELAKINPKIKKELRKAFPSTVTISNPLDLVGDADEKRYSLAITKALGDKNVDMIMVLVLFNTPAIDSGIVRELKKIKKSAKKPILVVTIGSDYTQKKRKELEKAGIITFSYPSVAARGLKALADYADFKKNHG
ncbi:MAG: CoA-binding protein [Candidatus Diapherotrites archaeon]|nr:CoA-binding protein [Candidatus Diapherotrites archaeon]